MSVALQFNLKDNATPAIEAKLAKCSPERLGKIVGQPLATFLRRHLAALPRNKRGWPSTGFWEEAADSVQFQPTPDGVVLRADKQGLRQRWKGGPIVPQNRDALTIPISPVSYGKRASDFPGLFLLRTRRGAYLVQRGGEISARTGRAVIGRRLGGNASRRRAADLHFLFKLSPGVNQKPNPKVIPTEDEFTEVALAAIERSVR